VHPNEAIISETTASYSACGSEDIVVFTSLLIQKTHPEHK
jgi:hypothetical protein